MKSSAIYPMFLKDLKEAMEFEVVNETKRPKK
jgi:hypothetical protein